MARNGIGGSLGQPGSGMARQFFHLPVRVPVQGLPTAVEGICPTDCCPPPRSGASLSVRMSRREWPWATVRPRRKTCWCPDGEKVGGGLFVIRAEQQDRSIDGISEGLIAHREGETR